MREKVHFNIWAHQEIAAEGGLYIREELLPEPKLKELGHPIEAFAQFTTGKTISTKFPAFGKGFRPVRNRLKRLHDRLAGREPISSLKKLDS